MQEHYHEILELPFTDFTLARFICWRDVLAVAKKHSFKNTTPIEFIQIVYYQLAIRNYKNVKLFLPYCDQNDIQVNFLNVLLEFGEEVGNWDIFYSPFWNPYVKLLDLGLLGYKPAMLAIGNIQIKIGDHSNDITELKAKVLDKLRRIEQNLIKIGADVYNIEAIRVTIDIILSNVQPNINYILKLAVAGSNGGILRFLRLRLKPFTDNYLNYNNLVKIHMNDFLNIIMTRLSEHNLTIIAKFLNAHSNFMKDITLLKSHSKFDPEDLIMLCVDQLYRYVNEGGDNVGIIGSYLTFFAQTKMSFENQYKIICNTTLLKFYSNGFLFHFLFLSVHNGIITNKRPRRISYDIDIINKEVVKQVIPIIEDFVVNYFWVWDKIIKVNCSGTFVNERIAMLDFILKISPLLWGPAMAVFGINLLNTKWSFSQEILISLIPFNPSYKRSRVRNDVSWADINNNVKCVMTNVLLELSNIDSICSDELMDEIDMDVLSPIQKKCLQLNDIINSGNFDNFYDAIFLLAEVDLFIANYRKRIKLHRKYMPDSKHYLLAKADFDNRTKK